MKTTDHNVDALINQMAGRLVTLLAERGIENPRMVGVHTGGVWVAKRLRQLLGVGDPLGTLNINFYRDDFSQIGLHPEVKPSDLPFDVDGGHIVLVDDVLFTGRTVRAALNELFDFGRPASVILAVLVDRSGRELPIRADVTGIQMQLGPREQVKLVGPDQLSLVVIEPHDHN